MVNLSNLEAKGLLELDGNLILASPPAEVIAQGTPAIFDYLENRIWWHFQHLMVSVLRSLAFAVVVILGLRYRQRGQRKSKQKRGDIKSAQGNR